MQTAGQAEPQGITDKSAPPKDSDGAQTLWWSSREHGRTLYVLPGGLLLRARMAA